MTFTLRSDSHRSPLFTASSLRHLLSALLLLPLLLLLSRAAAQGAPIEEMPVFTSDSVTHTLSLLLIARPKPVWLAGMNPTAWVYEVCPLALASSNQCAPGTSASPYGGVRFQLQPGDHLKIRLVNQLPPAPLDSEHAWGPDLMEGEMLKPNPTNLHTHGLIVEPRAADRLDPTYGDYVYVLAYPQGKKPSMMHPGLAYTDKPVNYDIYIPKNHPSGIFWFHPHVHGLSLNQISEGLAGIITIGSPDDYLSDQPAAHGLHGGVIARNLLLKDIEVESNNQVVDQEDPDFCAPDDLPGKPVRAGICGGLAPNGHGGGKWIFTMSGQLFPTAVIHGKGEIWRLVSGSGSRGYMLALQDSHSRELLPFQILSIDGVAIDGGSANTNDLEHRTGGRMKQVPCPSIGAYHGARPVCATTLRMMPSARTEIFLPASYGNSRAADFITQSLSTGPAGDTWPSVGLAHVVFSGAGHDDSPWLNVRPVATEIFEAGQILASPARVSVPGNSGALMSELRANPANTEHLDTLAGPSCKALPAGHTRRIFFGVPTGIEDGFGLGYEELDEHGQPVAGTFRDIQPFDHLSVTVCLPLAANNAPVTERWQLVNVSGEDHNFHIHQTRFRVLAKNAPLGDASGVMDNVPVLHGNLGCDGSVGAWRQGACAVDAPTVEIPFAEIGDFVYHCHILEHEDGGMMAHIRVVSHP